MNGNIEKSLLAPADEDTAEKVMAFLLRCAEAKRKYDDAELMSEIIAKRLMKGLKQSGFVLMKQAPQASYAMPTHQPSLF